MRSPPRHMTIRTNVSEEMYNCIENPLSISPPSSPQHHKLNDNHTNIELPSLSTTTTTTSTSSGGGRAFGGTTSLQQNGGGNHRHLQNNVAGNGYNNSSSSSSDVEKKKMEAFEISQNNNHNGVTNHYSYGEEEERYGSYNDDNRQHHHDSHNNNNHNNDLPSNENLLGTAFCSFMGFALVQTVVAIWAGSEAMLGDSAAMIVDALTYLFNWYAERKKSTYDSLEWKEATLLSSSKTNNIISSHHQDDSTKTRILERTKRKSILQLELIPPLLSVSTLVVVTFFVLKESISVLILDVNREIEKQGNPNIHIMMGFSIANLGLDLINVANFAKAKHLFGYETSETQHQDGHEALAATEDSSFDVDGGGAIITNNSNNSSRPPPRRVPSHGDDHDIEEDEEQEDQDHTANLNMCSAYTHVFADTLRSIAVLVAACLSELIKGITPEEADASAAVVVSGLILLSLVPLFSGLLQSYNELRLIRAEEKNDELMFS